MGDMGILVIYNHFCTYLYIYIIILVLLQSEQNYIPTDYHLATGLSATISLWGQFAFQAFFPVWFSLALWTYQKNVSTNFTWSICFLLTDPDRGWTSIRNSIILSNTKTPKGFICNLYVRPLMSHRHQNSTIHFVKPFIMITTQPVTSTLFQVLNCFIFQKKRNRTIQNHKNQWSQEFHTRKPLQSQCDRSVIVVNCNAIPETNSESNFTFTLLIQYKDLSLLVWP